MIILLPASYPLLSHKRYNRLTLVHINCYGTETRLSQCSRHKGITDSICHGGEAGVICSSMSNQHSKNTVNYCSSPDDTCEEGTVHLVGSDAVSRGRVLYCYQGTWYSLCRDGWNTTGEEARVVCQTIGYDTSRYGIYYYNYINYNRIMNNYHS